MGLSRGFCEINLGSSNPHVGNVPERACQVTSLRWARCFLGELFPRTLECWTYKLSKEICLWKRLVSSSGNTGVTLPSQLLRFTSWFWPKWALLMGVGGNPFFFSFYAPTVWRWRRWEVLTYRSDKHFGFSFSKFLSNCKRYSLLMPPIGEETL